MVTRMPNSISLLNPGTPTCFCAGVRAMASVICAHSAGGARECSGPASCSLRQYSVRVWRGMPAARQLPMYIASRPSCSARRAASDLGCASASGSSCPMAPTYACAALAVSGFCHLPLC